MNPLVILPVSQEVYDYLRSQLVSRGASDQIMVDGGLDMTGIAIQPNKVPPCVGHALEDQKHPTEWR